MPETAVANDAAIAKAHAWLKDHEQDLLQDTIKMLQIPSLENDPIPGGPFGAECKRALEFALDLTSKYGLKAKNLDGYVGYAEHGSGDKMVISLGHLDVVPVADGWKHKPFGAEIDGEYLYARGATDDKGPTMASFYAIRAIKECFPNLNVTLRQVFGINEESGFGCVEHYVANEPAPTYGIAPDGNMPLVYGEKSIGDLLIHAPLVSEGGFELLNAEGGARPNIVIETMVGKVRIAGSARTLAEEVLNTYFDKNVTWKWEGDVLNITATGKAAHGSTPWVGDSAATRFFRLLFEIAPLEAKKPLEKLLYVTHPSGTGVGIQGGEEATGDLTANLGIVQTVGNKLSLLVNVRYPTSWNGEKLLGMAKKKLEPEYTVTLERDSPGLYFPLDHPMVKSIFDAYLDERQPLPEPTTMGGGTYARAVPNCVCVGAAWEEDGDGKPHENDERIKVANLFALSRFYAGILLRLCRLAGADV
ncbi:MAG: Sapep family Mn(2+)-dependent dipeptidase [Armatimonadetes bacterium]|nr:Sapep family Mn(2+)-dependent dipeptidase [Armatimonadota bacterium]